MYVEFFYDSGSDCGSRKNMSDTNATDSINSQQTAETVNVQKKISRHSLQLHRKQLMMQRMLITHRVLQWDKSRDKSDAEFQSLLAVQKAVTTAGRLPKY